MIKFYKDSGKTTRIREIIGSLDGNGSDNQFIATENPSQVRRYSSSEDWGQLLSLPTDYSVSDNGDGTYTITLVSTPTTGQKIVAFSDGEFLFEGQSVISNSSNDSDRTLEQKVFIATDTGYEANSISIQAYDILPSYGADPSWLKVAVDNSGTPGTYGASINIAFVDVTPVAFWVKVVVAQNTPVENYHDICIQATGTVYSTHS